MSLAALQEEQGECHYCPPASATDGDGAFGVACYGQSTARELSPVTMTSSARLLRLAKGESSRTQRAATDHVLSKIVRQHWKKGLDAAVLGPPGPFRKTTTIRLSRECVMACRALALAGLVERGPASDNHDSVSMTRVAFKGTPPDRHNNSPCHLWALVG